MATDKMQSLRSMTTRQKVTMATVVVVVLVLIWQVSNLFRGEGSAAPTATPASGTAATNMSASSPGGGGAPPAMQVPTQAALPSQANNPASLQVASSREAELIKLQQETQAKYIAAVNELQLLKVNRDIASTNRDIATAKLASVTADKQIIELLVPPSPPPTDLSKNTIPIVSAVGPGQEVSYTVVSVSQLQYKWSAILSYKGNLYNVRVGDVLPPDSSKVLLIGRNGVTLEKDGVKKKVSLVPMI